MHLLTFPLHFKIMNPLTNPLLARSLDQVTATLQYFAYQPNFLEQLRVAFGDDFDSSVALGIRQLFQAGNFSLIPDLQVLANGELGAANGAYAGELDEIFVSSDFLAQRQGDVAAVTNLLLEEFGHKLDRLLNGHVDSPGDEGAIFAALAQGQTLSTDTLAQLRAEDDHRTIVVDGMVMLAMTTSMVVLAMITSMVGMVMTLSMVVLAMTPSMVRLAMTASMVVLTMTTLVGGLAMTSSMVMRGMMNSMVMMAMMTSLVVPEQTHSMVAMVTTPTSSITLAISSPKAQA
jgi:hypothetical protein